MFSGIFMVFIMGFTSLGLEASEGPGQTSVQIVETKSWSEKWAKSDPDVLKQFSLLRESLQQAVRDDKLSEADLETIDRAVAYAAEKHASQFRQNDKNTPYVVHPIGVANYVMKIGGVYDPDIIIGALLHDVMDGTNATYEEITVYFGTSVAGYVREMTDDPSLSIKERRKKQIINAFHQSKGATVIKLADKLHNLHTLMKDPSKGWTPERLDNYFQWIQAVADNLPEVNGPLKEEMHKTIANYWQGQEKSS